LLMDRLAGPKVLIDSADSTDFIDVVC
jgi:hypothetical protein